MTQVVLNGNAYSDDGSSSRDMGGGGHRQWLLPMLGDAATEVSQWAGSASDAAQAADASAQAADASAQAADASAQQAMDVLQEVIDTGSGWSPVLQIAVDGERHVLQVKDWTGGRGPKPAVGYLAATGVVPAIADGLNIRGAVAYSELTGKPSFGTAASMSVPTEAGGVATSDQVVRGDDPRLTLGGEVGYREFTTSQAWAKPNGVNFFFVEVLSASGSGAATYGPSTWASTEGGAGGVCRRELILASELGATINIVIGSGGRAVVANSAQQNVLGNDGGDSSFGSITSPGGLGGKNLANARNTPYAWIALNVSAMGFEDCASGGYNSSGGGSNRGGGGGGGAGTTSVANAGGPSISAGKGGAGVRSNAPGVNATASGGEIPAGGGGAASVYGGSAVAKSGAGARGRVRVWWW